MQMDLGDSTRPGVILCIGEHMGGGAGLGGGKCCLAAGINHVVG